MTNSNLTLVSIDSNSEEELTMYTGTDVYQPFSETGPLLGYIIEEIQKTDSESLSGFKFAEFGAGTAAFCVVVKKIFPDLEFFAYDNDPNAEKYMVANAELHNVDININIMDVSDIPDSTRFNFIFSSPPFYPSDENRVKLAIAAFPHKNDPSSAVYSGPTGLEDQALFLAKASSVTDSGAVIFVAHLNNQSAEVTTLLESNNFTVGRTVEQEEGPSSDMDCVFTIAYKN